MKKKSYNFITITLLAAASLFFYFTLIEQHKENIAPDAFLGSKEIDNVILVTIDTLRADHLGLMGYPRDTSPFLDELARDNIVFENMFTNIPTTVPSIASIFTGAYAFEHKVTNNYEYLDDSFETLAETFDKNGFSTFASLGSKNFFTRTNLTQGFNEIDYPGESEGDPYLARKTVDSGMNWIEKNKSNKNFIWLHFWGPHFPYDSMKDPSYSDPFTEKDERLLQYWKEEMGLEDEIFIEDKNKHIFEAINAYDTEIKVIDREISRFYNKIEELALLDQALLVIIPDHGESLGSHGQYEHVGSLYNESIKTPSIIVFPDKHKVSKKIKNITENIDIPITIYDILQFKNSKQPIEIQGESLLSLIKERFSTNNKDYALSWTGNIKGGMNFSSPGKVYIDKTFPNWGEKYSITSENFKYIINKKTNQDELYDLMKDPLEKINLADENLTMKEFFSKIVNQKVESLLNNQKRTPIDASAYKK